VLLSYIQHASRPLPGLPPFLPPPLSARLPGFVYEHGPFNFAFKGGKDSVGRLRQVRLAAEQGSSCAGGGRAANRPQPPPSLVAGASGNSLCCMLAITARFHQHLSAA